MNKKQKAIKIFNNRVKYTNSYVDFNHFLELIDNELFYVIDENIFILKSENNVYKFLYFTNDLQEISKMNQILNEFNCPISLEYATKETDFVSIFPELGFKPYKIFSRYSVNKESRIAPKRKSSEVQLATKNDINEVYDIANSLFDPLCDFIPTIKELEIFVENKELYIIKKDRIWGFALYVKKPYGHDFRLNCVVPEYQSKLVGYKFVASLPNEGKKCTCWVDDQNYPAIRLNGSIGFVADGLKNHIYVRNKTNGDENEK